MTIEQRVQRGIALLDEHIPGWRARIDVARLDMGSGEDGLIEQLYGTFHKGRLALGLTWNHDETGCIENGFDIAGNERGENNLRDWRVLTEAWRRALLESEG